MGTSPIYITSENIAQLKSAKPGHEVSLDLGRSTTTLTPEVHKALQTVEETSIKPNFIYLLDENQTLTRLEVFDRYYYKLRPWKGQPILEINGVRMHLVKSFEQPYDYGRRVAALLHLNQNIVLDTCFGLGYCTIAALNRGCKVVGVDKSRAVLSLAQLNPWSWDVFKNAKVVEADVNEYLDKTNQIFDAVIHDPPRISYAPELYSSKFYAKIKEHLRKGGLFYHYVGSVGKRRCKSIKKTVASLLTQSGFKVLKYDEKTQALIAKSL